MQEAMFWHKERNGIRCELCARNCFIAKDKRGYCLVRINKDNKLQTLSYGKLIAVNIDPIEKKPLFHFYPGSTSLSIASQGCNFRCNFCCNWEMSQGVDVSKKGLDGKDYTPEQIVDMAEKNHCKSISYTYTEPTMFFEFAYRTAKLARRSSIKNTLVTNGFINEEPIKKIAKYLDAVTIDIKGSLDPEFYKKFMSVPDVLPIYHALKQFKKQRVFIEVTNLIVTQFGDSVPQCTKFAQWVSSELDSDIPFHILQFYPSHQLLELPPTPVGTLEACIDAVKRTGLRYVYIGNVPGHVDVNTYCYNCRELLIERTGHTVKKVNIAKDRCPTCGLKINVVVD